MANQGQSTRLDTALKLLLITFVSLVAFFTGAYVGKAMSDSDHQLKAMEADFQTQKTAAEKHKDLDVADKDALVDEEVAQMSDKIVKSEKDQLGESEVKETAEVKAGAKGETEKVAAKGSEKSSEKTAEKTAAKTEETKPVAKTKSSLEKQTREVANTTEEKPIKKVAHVNDEPSLSVKKSKLDLSEVHKTAERIAHNETASDEPVSQKAEATNRVPSSLPKSVGTASGPGFTVQVASFPTSEEAKKQVDDLVKKGFPAFPIEATISGKTWYRVSLGNFKTQKEAAQYRLQLIKDSDIKKAIVAKVTN